MVILRRLSSGSAPSCTSYTNAARDVIHLNYSLIAESFLASSSPYTSLLDANFYGIKLESFVRQLERRGHRVERFRFLLFRYDVKICMHTAGYLNQDLKSDVECRYFIRRPGHFLA